MLEGTSVRLRALEVTDLERIQSWFNSQEVANFTSARHPMSMADQERWLREQGANDFVTGVRLSIETTEGRHIGLIGLRETRTENRKAELMVVIGEKECWSQGYGTDAVLTMLRFAFHEMNLHRVWLTTLEYNERAIACYRKCGFQEEARLREESYKHGRYWDFVLMGVLRDDFDALVDAQGASAERGA